jgi:hypothetical protein
MNAVKPLLRELFEWGLTLFLIIPLFVPSIRRIRIRNEKFAREEEERRKRRDEVEANVRAYDELDQWMDRSLKNCLLRDFEAIAQGKSIRLTTLGLQAAHALSARQGNHPVTIAAWRPHAG